MVIQQNALGATVGVALTAACAATAVVQTAPDRATLPIPEPQHPHSTVLDVRNAPPPPPRFEVTVSAGAPNVLIVLIDDLGFGQSSAIGGPIAMPAAERLAKNGLKYNHFHTTALSSPTRAALLTGRNHHTTNTGSIMETSTAFPGDTGQRPESVAPLATMLRYNGYATTHFGKNHEREAWEVSPSGPTDRWPTRSGFDKFYGFMGGETKQWAPAIYDVNGKNVAEGRIDQTQPMIFSADEGVAVGEDGETPVVESYDIPAPYEFTGTIEKVTVELQGMRKTDKAEEDKALALAAHKRKLSD